MAPTWAVPGLFIFTRPKTIFPGSLSQRKQTGNNTQWVFETVVEKFEHENLENNTKYSSNFDFTNFENQNFVEWNTASGNTEKTFQRTDHVRNKTFCCTKL